MGHYYSHCPKASFTQEDKYPDTRVTSEVVRCCESSCDVTKHLAHDLFRPLSHSLISTMFLSSCQTCRTTSVDDTRCHMTSLAFKPCLHLSQDSFSAVNISFMIPIKILSGRIVVSQRDPNKTARETIRYLLQACHL